MYLILQAVYEYISIYFSFIDRINLSFDFRRWVCPYYRCWYGIHQLVNNSINHLKIMTQISTAILGLVLTQIIMVEFLVFLNVIPLVIVQHTVWDQPQLACE